MPLILRRSSSISSWTASRSLLLADRRTGARPRPGRCRNPRGADRPGRSRSRRTWLAARSWAWMRSSSLRTLPRTRCASAVSSARCRSNNSRSVDVLDGLAGERLLAEVEFGNFRFRRARCSSGDASARLEALGQLLVAVGDGPAPLLPAFLDLPQPGVQVAEPFLALGQLDLGLGGFAAAGLPLRLQGGDLLGQVRPGGFPSRQAPASSSALLAGPRPAGGATSRAAASAA